MDAGSVQKIVNSIGLVFDIFGAWLVAWEVVNQYEGKQFNGSPLTYSAFTPPPDKTPEFIDWEKIKYKKMKLGILLLTIGFVLQIASNWICPQTSNAKYDENKSEVASPSQRNVNPLGGR